MVPMLRSATVVLAAALSLTAGCDLLGGMAESQAHGAPIAAEIERLVGIKPDVFSAVTGSVLVVTVSYSEVPALPVPALEAVARAAIVHEFKKEPTMLTISFVYQKAWPPQ